MAIDYDHFSAAENRGERIIRARIIKSFCFILYRLIYVTRLMATAVARRLHFIYQDGACAINYDKTCRKQHRAKSRSIYRNSFNGAVIE